MDLINYISTDSYESCTLKEYFNISQCNVKSSLLNISVRTSIYNQYYELFLKSTVGRKSSYNAHELCKLFFLINFSCCINECAIPTNIFSSITKKHEQLSALKSTLKELGLIDYSFHREKYNEKYKSYITTYSVNEIKSSLDYSSKSYKIIQYIVDNSLYLNKIKSNLKYTKSTIKNTILPYIDGTLSAETYCESIGYDRKGPIEKQSFSIHNFIKNYHNLVYKNDDLTVNFMRTQELSSSIPHFAKDNRLYHAFHKLTKEERANNIFLDNEHLVEAFDVHNCQHALLNALLPSSIPTYELNNYYNISMNGKLYEDVMCYVNNTICSSWDREYAKLACNRYYNISNKKIRRARKALDNNGSSTYIMEACVDKYFETFFPHIREFIFSNKDVLHNNLNEVESNIIIYSICKELLEKHGIEAITLHDGIYVKEKDLMYMSEHNISTSSMFRTYIDAYKFL